MEGTTDLQIYRFDVGHQRCTRVVMRRLKNKMSPLLDRLLCILRTSANEERTTAETNPNSVISFRIPPVRSILRVAQPSSHLYSSSSLFSLFSLVLLITTMSTYHLFIHSAVSARRHRDLQALDKPRLSSRYT